MDKTHTPNDTLAYYAKHADEFASSTANIEFSEIQNRFISLLAPGASILDFGCGSGRDTKYFMDEGFRVTAIDGSPELCAIASELAGIPVRNELFGDLADVEAYDGIWACSSILHLPKDELSDVFRRMARALRTHGLIYTSFCYGEFEGMRNGRHFTDFTEPTFRSFLSSIPQLAVDDLWISGDVRPEKESKQWLNLILRKVAQLNQV